MHIGKDRLKTKDDRRKAKEKCLDTERTSIYMLIHLIHFGISVDIIVPYCNRKKAFYRGENA